MMKIRQKVRDTFEFYRRVASESSMEGTGIPSVQSVVDGLPAIEAFAAMEATGARHGTSEPALLQQVLRAKAHVNLHIKMWAEGIAEGLFHIVEFQRDHTWWPAWVWKAVRSQEAKIRPLTTPWPVVP